MIYWLQNLPMPLYDDKWKPVISYKWLRESFMAFVYLLQFVLFVLFMIYVKTHTLNYDINMNSSIYKILSYISNHKSIIYISLIAMFIGHEILHIIVIFKKGDFSITFNWLYFWITTNAEMSKFRYFLFTFLPLFILAAIPFIISLFIFNDLAFIIRLIAFGNLIISSADIINIIFILTKPNKAIFCRGMYHI